MVTHFGGLNAGRRRARQPGPGWRAARQWQRRLPPTPTRPPTSARSDLLRRSPRMLSHRHTPAVPHAGDQLGRAQLARRQQLTHLVTRRFWFQTRRPVLPAAQVSPRLGNHACPPGYCPIKEDLGAVVTPAGFRQAAAVRSRPPDRQILTLNCPCGGAALSFIDLELRVRLGLAETLAPAIRSTLHNFPQSCKAN